MFIFLMASIDSTDDRYTLGRDFSGYIYILKIKGDALHKKWTFPLRISSVNGTKSAVSTIFCAVIGRGLDLSEKEFIAWKMKNIMRICNIERMI